MKERLIELLKKADENSANKLIMDYNDAIIDNAEYLIAHGVIVPPCKPIGVMSAEDELNADVYCPYCGTNLSGLYGEEPTSIIQCYICGEFLDNTKTITKEEAEKALAERNERE